MLDTVREFKYTKLSPEEQKARGILGRLAGIIADFKHPTRNERFYSESLWDKTFDQPLMKEKLENKLLLGELNHPLDGRNEIDMEKVAICLAEKPVKCDDGKVRGVFDILDTPNGRILKTLCDYGCKIGVSSRGNGDVFEDYEHGGEKVDEDTYEMECWDAVLIPAVKEARPQYVTESLNTKTLKKALTEALDNSSKDDRKVMEKTLEELNIDIKPEKEEDIKEEKEVEKTEEAANNDGAELVEQLQESLKKQETLEAKVIELQEQLSARYAREAKYEEELTKYKNVVVNLSESARAAKELKSKVDSLQEELKKTNDAKLKSNLNSKALNENLNSINSKYDSLNSRYESLKENYKVKGQRVIELEKSLLEANKLADSKEKLLKEDLEEVKQNSAIKTKEYSQKLEKANNLVEHYRNIAQKAVDKYIAEKARMLGVSANEIKNKLNENYSFNDIDKICESLKSYNLSVSKLPFQVEKIQKVKVTESKNDPLKIPNGLDDTVDEDLERLFEGYQQN